MHRGLLYYRKSKNMPERSRINFLEAQPEKPQTPLVQIELLPETILPAQTKKRPSLWPLFFLLSVIILLTTCFFLYKAIQSQTIHTNNDPLLYDDVTLEPKQPTGFLSRLSHIFFYEEQTLKGEKEDRINVLLLGMGGPGHDGPYLTDTIMVVSIKPSTNEVAMISLPRDMGVDIPNQGLYKINHANHFGEKQKAGWGGAFASEIISETLGIPIHYYVRVDFKAFEEIINEVGGITVNVDQSFVDPLFPLSGTIEYKTVSFKKGVTSMDGDTALTFARSRHGNNGEGSDFARAARQQKVILALKEKMLSYETILNPVRINSIMKSLDTHMTTNMTFDEMLTFIRKAKTMQTDTLHKIVFDSSPQGPLKDAIGAGGAYLLLPKSGSYQEIQQHVVNVFDTTRHTNTAVLDDTPAQDAPTYTQTVIEVQNGTWSAGMAARIEKRLKDAGIDVTTIGNTESRPVTQSGIYTLTSDAPSDVTQSISSLLQIPPRDLATITPVVATGTQILVILGEDFSE
jgi:polyisoprenyl-teichoic acid--peptidoglycan teichoic acid transferase